MPKMTYRSANPIDDFNRQDADDYEAEQKCPVCSNCGHIITPREELFEACIGNQRLILCHHCCGKADWQYISEMERQL